MNIRRNQIGFMWPLLIITLFGVLLLMGYIGYKAYRPKDSTKPLISNTEQVDDETNTTQQSSESTPISYTGTLKGKVTCTEKIDPIPCTTTIELESDPTSQSMGSYGPVKTVSTDENGEFSITLEPGRYTVVPAPKAKYPMFVPPFTNPIIIEENKTTELTINYHDGTK